MMTIFFLYFRRIENYLNKYMVERLCAAGILKVNTARLNAKVRADGYFNKCMPWHTSFAQ